MPTESCPRCGEKAISQTGHCVFCGAVVIAPTIAPGGKEYDKAMRIYRFVSVSFLLLGVLYLTAGVIGTAMIKKPMLGLFFAALVTLAHGVLLILNNDWIRSITKVVCSIRLGVFALVILTLAPYFFHLGALGITFGLVFLFDVYCLILMIRTIDEVHFA